MLHGVAKVHSYLEQPRLFKVLKIFFTIIMIILSYVVERKDFITQLKFQFTIWDKIERFNPVI